VDDVDDLFDAENVVSGPTAAASQSEADNRPRQYHTSSSSTGHSAPFMNFLPSSLFLEFVAQAEHLFVACT
jgi:hypothetical protein